MSGPFILSIDQGTTGSTALVVDLSDTQSPQVIGRSTVDFPQHFPQTGWVEHDLEEIWASVRKSVLQAFQKASGRGFQPRQLASIGITNQRETLCVFDRNDSRPLTRAIVWQCKRSTDICRRLRHSAAAQDIRSKTGLVVDPYFTATKITWLIENQPEIAQKIHSGSALLGTIDTYLLHRLSGAKSFATEASNASRTLLLDLERGRYDSELCRIFSVPTQDALPEIKDSAGLFGKTKGLDFIPDGIPITGILGDQQAAMAGQSCYEPGEAKCTYGTGAFLLLNLGDQFVLSQAGLLTTILWSLQGKRSYAFEGASFVAGAAVQFMRDQLGLVSSSQESEDMAAGVIAAPDLIFVPALAGLGAPHWVPEAKGAIYGLTRGTSKEQLVRATLEGIAFQVNELVQSMLLDAPGGMKVLRVDGGASQNDLMMQYQANLSHLQVDRPQNVETTALGAALFAALGCGIYSSLNQMKSARQVDRLFTPHLEQTELMASHWQAWQRAVSATKVFADKETHVS